MASTGLYRFPRRTVPVVYNAQELDDARHNNQFVMTGSDPEWIDDEFDFFLEYATAGGMGFNIVDFFGVQVAGTLPDPLDWTHAPLYLPGGFTLTGSTIQIAKGFTIVHSLGADHTIIQAQT